MSSSPKPAPLTEIRKAISSLGPAGKWIGDHPGTAGSGLLLLYTVVRLMLVARGSRVTALALLDAAGPGKVLVAGLLALYPAFAALILWELNVSNSEHILKQIGETLLLIVVLDTVPWPTFVTTSFFSLSLGHLERP